MLFDFEGKCKYEYIAQNSQTLSRLVRCSMPLNEEVKANVLIAWFVYIFVFLMDLIKVGTTFVPIIFCFEKR